MRVRVEVISGCSSYPPDFQRIEYEYENERKLFDWGLMDGRVTGWKSDKMERSCITTRQENQVGWDPGADREWLRLKLRGAESSKRGWPGL